MRKCPNRFDSFHWLLDFTLYGVLGAFCVGAWVGLCFFLVYLFKGV